MMNIPSTPSASQTVGPNARWMTITPTQAKEWIERNDRNRSVRRKHVEKIARAIREGKFKLNGETIKIAPDGRILDGQHRLHACVSAGINISCLVVTDLDPGVIDTVDTGIPKEAHDVLTMAGKNVSKNAVSTTRIIYQLHRQEMFEIPSLAPHEVERFYEAYRARIEWALGAVGKGNLHPGTVRTGAPLWAAFAFCHPIAPAKVESAAYLLKNGSSDVTIEALRCLLAKGSLESIRYKAQARLDLTITYMRAIEAFIDDESLSRLFVRNPADVLVRISSRVIRALKTSSS